MVNSNNGIWDKNLVQNNAGVGRGGGGGGGVFSAHQHVENVEK